MGMIIDGKAIAREVRNQVKGGIDSLKRKRGVVPGLAVVLVGDDPSSHLYIRNKKEVGIESSEHLLPEALSENELISLIHTLNRDKAIHGILVQLPLPAHISAFQSFSP